MNIYLSENLMKIIPSLTWSENTDGSISAEFGSFLIKAIKTECAKAIIIDDTRRGMIFQITDGVDDLVNYAFFWYENNVAKAKNEFNTQLIDYFGK
jgi:hypothetical protein